MRGLLEFFGESGSDYQAERLSRATLQGDQWDDTGGYQVYNTIKCGSRQCGLKLDIADSGGQGVHTGRTGTQGGMEFEGFLIRLWDTGITGPGVATWNTKRPNRNFLADQFDGKCCKFKDNDVTVKSYQIGDVRRGA